MTIPDAISSKIELQSITTQRPIRSVYLLSLGCAKNLVDSESMSQILRDNGLIMTAKPETANVIVVNTCGFIEPAKKEAIDQILRMADFKKPNGHADYLIVAGCLSQRYAQDILSQMPEVNAVLGTADYDRIFSVIQLLDQEKIGSTGQLTTLPGPGGSLNHLSTPRIPSTPQAYAYIKVAEGCSNHCTYCAIPGIRGPFISRPFEDLIAEATRLSQLGYGELILIAQDTTRYGLDLYGIRRLPELIRQICLIPAVRMVRILYVYNDGLTDEMIETMATEPKVAHYLDLPIQHASDSILSSMNRRDSQENIRQTISRLRQAMPDLILRSTVLVGFPGETAADFDILKNFIREIEFDRLGCFVFSAEEGTPAFDLKPKVRQSTAQARMNQIMKIQQQISLKSNQKRLNQINWVTLESVDEDGVFYKGRSYAEAPEVDPVILVAASSDLIQVGQTVQIRVVDVGEYELTGVTLE
ncbi:MAG: 30S ribosomal protein S12 methylthiotransferase RimO [Eubacteriales bacterium]|nr:30S ribosomal protein S12 methylthiotransferase RimO [Eubacteriales bacterium]